MNEGPECCMIFWKKGRVHDHLSPLTSLSWRLNNYIRVTVVTLVGSSSWRLLSGWVLCFAEESNVSTSACFHCVCLFLNIYAYYRVVVWRQGDLTDGRSNSSYVWTHHVWLILLLSSQAISYKARLYCNVKCILLYITG